MSTKPLAQAAPTAYPRPVLSQLKESAVAPMIGVWSMALLVLSALLVAASGCIHLYLWHVAYQQVPTLGPLFLVQVIAAFVLAVALLALRRLPVVVASAALMIGTIVGFILVTTVGLFGFTLSFISGWAKLALITEICAVLVLSVLTVMTWRHQHPSTADVPGVR